MASFGDAFATFLSTVGSALNELVEDVKPDTTTQSTPAAPVAAQTRSAAPVATATRPRTQVQLDVEVDGDGTSLLRELDRESGGDRSPASVAAFLQNRGGVRVTAWRAPQYPGYGSTAR